MGQDFSTRNPPCVSYSRSIWRHLMCSRRAKSLDWFEHLIDTQALPQSSTKRSNQIHINSQNSTVWALVALCRREKNKYCERLCRHKSCLGGLRHVRFLGDACPEQTFGLFRENALYRTLSTNRCRSKVSYASRIISYEIDFSPKKGHSPIAHAQAELQAASSWHGVLPKAPPPDPHSLQLFTSHSHQHRRLLVAGLNGSARTTTGSVFTFPNS